jgi:PDZ domain-containing protein
MTRRDITLVVALTMLIGLVIVGRLLTVPYVILEPGPVTDTLGTISSGQGAAETSNEVVSIAGAKAQPTSGHIYLTTVSSLPCGEKPTLYNAVTSWFNSHEAVEPYEIECPPDESNAQAAAKDQQEMEVSQSHAIIAAFTELGYTSTGNRIVVGGVAPNHPVSSVLRKGDVIESVDGKQIHSGDEIQTAVRSVKAGQSLSITFLRGDSRMTRSIQTFAGTGGVTTLGIDNLRTTPTFNNVAAQIGISPKQIGGPSAGTALALGIVDKLTPGGLTGGRTIAGTGTVSPTGKVGEIGGIQQKIAAAAANHATVFFAPAGECHDAEGAAPSSMTLVAIKTLHDAVLALKAIKSGSSDFPHC